jgi:flagellar protein FliO/FliZ
MTSPNMDSFSWARVVLACAVVAALLALMGMILKYIKLRGFKIPGTPDDSRRLHIVESLMIDPRRRLVIVRCDGVEHLLLLGANEDIVVAANLEQHGQILQTKRRA